MSTIDRLAQQHIRRGFYRFTIDEIMGDALHALCFLAVSLAVYSVY